MKGGGALLPHPVDIALGARLRARRAEVGVSQEILATALNLTFQQVQKYEKGTNRVSFSRLTEIANALDISVVDLVAPIVPKRGATKPVAGAVESLSLLNKPNAREFLELFASITDSKRRRIILTLMEICVENQGD